MIEAFFNTVKPQVDSELSRYLHFQFHDPRQELANAMSYSVENSGKRVRPLLTIASHLLFNDNIQSILPLACAIEIMHTYTLIHDDLPAMDDDDFRRGKPSCHKAFQEDMAILAGDTLNTMSFEILAKDLRRWFSSDDILNTLLILSNQMGIHGVAGGQALDIRAELGDDDAVNKDYVHTMHLKKTAALIQSCTSLPAILNKQPDSVVTSLKHFGKHLGYLFQIIDDILDVIGDPDKMGKTVGKDNEQNKLTVVSLYGLENAKVQAAKEARAAKQILRELPFKTELLSEFVTYVEKRSH